ncbi:MAG: Xaa-Pro peptidase family protein [Fermentimonas sp.]|nr:Xaa-Pro peptidase family protein [Fermentimonas sp.]
MNELTKEESNLKFEKIQNITRKKDAGACIITSSVNQYWLCGFIFDGYLYITADRDPILFVKRPSDLDDERIISIRKPEQIPGLLQEAELPLPKRILIESDQLTLNAANRLQAALNMPELLNISDKIRKIRSVKSEYELNQMRECAKIHSEVYQLIPALYRKGMSDLQLQIEIEREMRLRGSVGIFRSFGENMDIFMGSILAGDNAQIASPYDYALGGEGITPLLPLGANGTPLKPGTTVMVDMAGNYSPYMDDMTRTFAIEHAPEIAYKAHEVSIEIHNAVKKQAKAGTLCSDIYSLAEEMVISSGLQPYFMGTVQQAKFIGHGVGLEINEPPVITPRSKDTLLSGMAIALEPKFVLPGIGAAGIENTYIVHDEGLENITQCEERIIVLK